MVNHLLDERAKFMDNLEYIKSMIEVSRNTLTRSFQSDFTTGIVDGQLKLVVYKITKMLEEKEK